MIKAIVIFWVLLFSLNISSGQQTPVHKDFIQNVDSLKKQFAKHFKVLDKAAKKKNKGSNTDVIYCCQAAVNFMADKTNIEPGTMGNRLGYPGFTKVALKQWHKWYYKKYGKKK